MIRLISKVDNIKEFASSFYQNNVSASEITEIGEKVMLVLYGNSQSETTIQPESGNVKECGSSKSSSSHF